MHCKNQAVTTSNRSTMWFVDTKRWLEQAIADLCSNHKMRTIRISIFWHAPSTQAGCEEWAGLVPGHNAPQHSLGHHPHWAVMHLCKGSGHLAVHRQQGLFPGPHCHFRAFRLIVSTRQSQDWMSCLLDKYSRRWWQQAVLPGKAVVGSVW